MSGKGIDLFRATKSFSESSPNLVVNNKATKSFRRVRDRNIDADVNKTMNDILSREILSKLYYNNKGIEPKYWNKEIYQENMSILSNTTQHVNKEKESLNIKAMKELNKLYHRKYQLSKRKRRMVESNKTKMRNTLRFDKHNLLNTLYFIPQLNHLDNHTNDTGLLKNGDVHYPTTSSNATCGAVLNNIRYVIANELLV